MRVQNVEELDLTKVTIVAKIDLAKKSISTAKVSGIRATDKMVDLREAQHVTYCQRKYKGDIGTVGTTYATSNILLAYDEEHLNAIMDKITWDYKMQIMKRIESYEETLGNFISSEWVKYNK